MSLFKIDQERSYTKILLASISGIYLHILIDAPTHLYMQPLFPLLDNPFSGSFREIGVSAFEICTYLLLSGILAYATRLIIYYWRRKLRKIYLNPSKKFRWNGFGLISVGAFLIIRGFNDMIIWYHDLRMVFLIILIIMLPIIVVSMTFDFISIIEAIQKNRKLKSIRLKYWNHNCADCGSKITLEEKLCNKCGGLNEIRKLVLQYLKKTRITMEEIQIKMSVKQIGNYQNWEI
jgi:membrane-bound metal-dependent hydrolase YbcI (DUF457 family)